MTQRTTESRNSRVTVTISNELRELATTYLARRQGDMETITSALASRDFAAIETIGHRLKGSGASMGFEALTEIGHALESAAAASDDSTIERELAHLRDYLARVDVEFS